MLGAWANPIELPRRWRIGLGLIEVTGPIGLAVIPLATTPKWFSDYGAYSLVAVAVITVLAIVSLRIMLWYGEPAKPYVDCLLKELASEVWAKTPENLIGPVQQHRVTLFELKKRWWLCTLVNSKWTHYLVPRTRWPRSARRPRRVFRVHEHFTENGEGVCGQIHAMGAVVTTGLPNLHGLVPATDADYSAYAKLTLDEIGKVKHEKYYARVIGGITVYLQDGRKWGVLAFDSPDPDALAGNCLDSKAARRTLAVLSGVLSESQR
jgi:hypothetical protein